MKFEIISDVSQEEFLNNYVAKNTPVIVRGIPFEPEHWTPAALKESIGDLTAQMYGTLFDLEDILSASDYLDDYFGTNGPYQDDVPYIRWYNQLKDIDFAWGDEAFNQLSTYWQKPVCIPDRNLIVPLTNAETIANPVKDRFPYRGVLLAARGARTRLHRDPFCTDAVVSQFYGTKEAALYHPSRAQELLDNSDGSSFGGFMDMREADINQLSHEPDFHGEVNPGDMIYIPHGWLHDVIVVEDSISVTWNFIHEKGAREFEQYLTGNTEEDSEFEILQYFYSLAGFPNVSAQEIMEQLRRRSIA